MNIKLKLLKHKIELTKKILLLISIVVFTMSIIRLFEENYLQFFIDMCFVFILIYSFIILRKDETKLFIIARVTIASALITTLFVIINSIDFQMGFMWLTTIIYFMFYYLGRSEGLKWFVNTMLVLLGLFFYDPMLLSLDTKSFFIWISNMIFIILIVGWYEQIKVDAEKDLMGHQAQLTAQVKEKTKELKLLNNSLESRIAKELEINHQQQEELIKKSRHAQMGEMISMIAHQWRQPLAAISSSVNTLKLRNMLGDYEKEYFDERLDRISSYAQHLSGTINDFRDFLKSQKYKKESSLDNIANGVFSIISPIVKNKNIELSTQYSANQMIMTYPNELKQVVLNLIQNAIDTLEERCIKDPLITLRTYKKEDKLILEVEDNGGGIPQDIIENIFDPYYSTKKSKDGTGLGLYMSKIMVEEHCNGLLSACNEKDGALFAIEVSV